MLPMSVTYLLCTAALLTAWVAVSVPILRIVVAEWRRSGRCARCVFTIAASGACLYGGAKHITGRVSFPYTDPETRYLYDAGSFVTNDYVHVAFTKSPLLPNDADLLGYVRPVGSTNDEEWVQMLDTTFGRFSSPSNVPYQGAISNDFEFFTTWTPGPVVHTNGVAVVMWQRPFDSSTNRLTMIRTGVYTNGFRVAPSPGLTNGPPITLTVTMTISPSAASPTSFTIQPQPPTTSTNNQQQTTNNHE